MPKWPLPLAMAVATISAVPATAQDTSEADVLAVVDTFFQGLNNADSRAMKSVVTDIAIAVAIVPGRNDREVFAETLEDSIDRLADGKGRFQEVIRERTAIVEGPIAVVWAPYAFYEDGELSHCGTNVLNLLRIGRKWKVTGVQYSVDTEGCTAEKILP